MGAGAIIHQNSVVKTAVNDASIYGVLPNACKGSVDTINQKPVAAWSESDYAYMVSMLNVARHC